MQYNRGMKEKELDVEEQEVEAPEAEKETDFFNDAKEAVIEELAQITNLDLNYALGIEIQKYFEVLNKDTQSLDKFKITNLTQILWNTYGDFIDHHRNELETPEFKELDLLMHSTFMPKIIEILTDYSVIIATAKS